VEVSKMAFMLNQKGMDNQNLIIRRKLEPIRESIIAQIKSSPEGTLFYYDFSKVEGINGSGVDEIISKVIKHLVEEESDKFLFITNLREEYYEHRFNIDNFLKNRTKVGIVEQVNEQANFLGDISDTQKELLELIYKQKEVTARYLSDILDKKLSLISTHLNTLYKNKLIKRTEEQLQEGGRQFLYKSLF
jgi:predicted HTH transcriptional regulator